MAATEEIVFHRARHSGLLGALAYLGFDALVLWTAFVAIHAHPAPGFAVVVMADIIGALGVSILRRLGLERLGNRRDADPYGVGRGPAVAAGSSTGP